MSRYFRWKRYVPVAERRANARRVAAQLARQGKQLQPVEVQGRTIARSFWGKAWCTHLEAYSDYKNRLPRGRTYARNGSVVHLEISQGQIEAMVSGSEMYDVTVRIDTLSDRRWKGVLDRCAGQIDSLVELLQGKLSDGVMEVVTDRRSGLFPAPREIHLHCSCPDWATMCKHVAAVLYGVGNRLDHEPAMLFSLRGVDPSELIEEAIDRGVAQRRSARGRVLAEDDLSSVFGIDLDPGGNPPDSQVVPAARRQSSSKKSTASEPAPSAARGPALSSTALQVLAMITDEAGVAKPRIAEWLGLTGPQVGGAIAELRRQGLVELVGPPRSGGYQRIKPAPGKQAHPAEALSSRALQVLAVISDEPGLRAPQLAEWLGLSPSQVRGAITQLRRQRLVEFVGARSTGGYERVGAADR